MGKKSFNCGNATENVNVGYRKVYIPLQIPEKGYTPSILKGNGNDRN